MRIGIIGSGKIGGTAAKLFGAANHEVGPAGDGDEASVPGALERGDHRHAADVCNAENPPVDRGHRSLLVLAQERTSPRPRDFPRDAPSIEA